MFVLNSILLNVYLTFVIFFCSTWLVDYAMTTKEKSKSPTSTQQFDAHKICHL